MQKKQMSPEGREKEKSDSLHL